ncbi:MAG TPA: DUF5666 domain-containing protein, partial [Chloroflexia bacterium]|nr:DUF5666 domain-containing protein [Chloroflexia bacterium]
DARPAARIGNVSAITAAGFTLETRAGNLTVTVSDLTWIVVEKDGRAVEGTLADLVAGNPAAVAGMLSPDGKTVAARTVAQGPMARRLADRLSRVPRRPAAQALQHVAGGTITAIDGSEITLKGDRVPDVVVLSLPETIVLRGGFSDLASLKVGERIEVLGVPVRPAEAIAGGRRTLEAWAIRVDSGATGFFHGRVGRVDGTSLVVHNIRGRDRLTVSVDSNTQFKRVAVTGGRLTVSSVALSDVQAGGHVAVEGTVAPNGRVITAKAVVLIGPPRAGSN